jgi:hypothetical protein
MDGETEDNRIRTLSIEAAIGDRSWMQESAQLDHLSVAQVSDRVSVVRLPRFETFTGTVFTAVTDPTQKPGARSVVVAIRGSTAQRINDLNDFQDLLQTAGIPPIESAETALDIARQYAVTLGTEYPQYSEELSVLESADEIAMPNDESVPVSIDELVEKPTVHHDEDHFHVQFVTWTAVSGILKKFEVDITDDGTVSVGETELRDGVGQFWLPK